MKIIRGAKLFDGTGKHFDKPVIVINDEGRIEYVGEKQYYQVVESDAQIIDVKDKFILPGLIDCHIHMDSHGMPDTFAENFVEDKLRSIRVAKEMEDTLMAGFTTVRNAGSANFIDFSVKEAINKGWAMGPRILTSGKILSITCSGTEYFAGLYRLADGYDEFKKAAREQLKMGADFLKVMATGAFMNPGGVPGAEQTDLRELEAIVEEANKLGKKVAAHAHGAQGIKNAIKAGVYTIEHGSFIDEEGIEMMLDKGIYLVPTLAVDYFWKVHGVEGGVPEHMVEKAKQTEEASMTALRKAVKAGVKIAMGTDAGTPYNHHGLNAIELVLMVEKGLMTPEQAIIMATKTASEACDIAEDTGTLEKGKYADLIVVDGDPFKDIKILIATNKIQMVMKEGDIVKGLDKVKG